MTRNDDDERTINLLDVLTGESPAVPQRAWLIKVLHLHARIPVLGYNRRPFWFFFFA